MKCLLMSKPPTSAGYRSVMTKWPVRVDSNYNCWLWVGKLDKQGYSRHKGQLGYLVVYEAEIGPVPEGLFLDHLCRRRSCVNPAHLQPVNQSTNEKRKSWAHRSKIKNCPNGHDLWRHGRRTPEGGKVCMLCGDRG